MERTDLDISIDIEKTSKVVSLRDWVFRGLVAGGVAFTLTPFFFKGLDRESKTLFLVGGFLSSLTASLLPTDYHEKKVKKTFLDSVLGNYRNQVGHEIFRANAITEIEERNKLAQHIETKVEPWQLQYWANKFGVTNLISAFYIQENTDDEQDDFAPNSSVIVQEEMLKRQLKAIEKQNNLNLSWINENIFSSKILAGRKGTGKSYLMRYFLARFILENPNGIWYVIDPHYSGYENNEEEPFDKNNPNDAWLLGIEPELLKDKIVDNPKDGFKLLSKVFEIFNQRVAKKQRCTGKSSKIPRVMVFLDELEAFKRELSDDDFEDLVEMVTKIQDEGRKFGVEVTIGAHSIKKERIGLDSTVIGQMLWVLFENAVVDGATAFPKDFDSKQIVREYRKINQTKDSSKERLIFVAQPDGNQFFQLLPRLPLPTFEVGTDQTLFETTSIENSQPTSNEETKPDYVTVICQWIESQHEQTGKSPNRETIREGWLKLTDQRLTDEGLDLLIEKIKEYFNNK